MTPTALLFVEDDAMCRSIRFMLEVEGISNITCARHVEAAKAAAAGNACLIIDHVPRTHDALDLLRHLRGSGVSAHAIILAGTRMRRLEAAASAIGATLVEKPMLGTQLVAAIRGHATKRQPSAF